MEGNIEVKSTLVKYLRIFENMLGQDDDEKRNVKQISTSSTDRKSDDKIRAVDSCYTVKTCRYNSNIWTEVISTLLHLSRTCAIPSDGVIEINQNRR